VYETLAEGGVTRFMALFQSQEVDVLGPVRSARTYFAEIVREYGASYAHVGGSASALSFIARHGLSDLDQFALDKPYWRDPGRWKTKGLEHSMYTNTKDLRKYIKTVGLLNVKSWNFQTTDFQAQGIDSAGRSIAQSISIDFSFPVFKVEWQYDPVKNVYKRFNGGVSHVDAQNGQQLEAKNVLVQYATMTPILNPAKGDESALDIDVVGTGEVFRLQEVGHFAQGLAVQQQRAQDGLFRIEFLWRQLLLPLLSLRVKEVFQKPLDR
jgi:hypothetical protein